MKKHILIINISIFISLSCLNISAQNISGSITYQGVVNQKFVDSLIVETKKEKMPMYLKKDIINAMENAHPDVFVLNFKNDESYYYKKPTLVENKEFMGSRAGSAPYYVNKTLDKTIKISRPLGNIDKIPFEWEITNQTKKIGKYNCRQAKITEKLYSREGHFFNKNVIAWFTPEIPVSFGPKNYNGLPGLILQIEDKAYTLTAVKINLNPKEDLKINRINEEDKIISETESHKRIEEMMGDREKMYKN